MLVSIVTATTGNPLLKQAIQSVQNQDYPDIEHIIVVDGIEREEKSRSLLNKIAIKKPTHLLTLPFSTGADGYICHRIYGLSSFIINGNYIMFLDDDNWFEPNHVSSLVETIASKNLDWAFALRKIVSQTGEFITNDDCESLGGWLAFEGYHHVDTNCYLIKKEVAISLSPIWYRKFREEGVVNPDCALCNILVEKFQNFATNGIYSVNYRIGSTPQSVSADFFLYGNSIMQQRYNNNFPWRKQIDNNAYEELTNEQLQAIFQGIELIKNDLHESAWEMWLNVIGSSSAIQSESIGRRLIEQLRQEETELERQNQPHQLTLIQQALKELMIEEGENITQYIDPQVLTDKNDYDLYSSDFYSELLAWSEWGAQALVPLLIAQVNPASVIDVGCGTGVFLSHFKQLGIHDILGLEGSHLSTELLSIPTENFRVMNLNSPYPLHRSFDLVLCLEVAEHLPESSADRLIAFLVSLSPVVCFSGATPGQGGTGHINEQPHDYWHRRFASWGYEVYDSLRSYLEPPCPWWYINNTFLYKQKT